LYYNIVQTSIPLEREIATVLDVTNNFVKRFFLERYSDMEDVQVEVTGKEFNFGEPYRIDYDATATFQPGSIPPSQFQLNQVLSEVFAGDNLNAYISELQQLQGTVFNTINSISSGEVSPQASRFSMRVSIASAACVFAILISAVFLYRQRKSYDLMEKADYNPTCMTIAGETYESTTYAGSHDDPYGAIQQGHSYEERDSAIDDAIETPPSRLHIDDNDVVSTAETPLRMNSWSESFHGPLQMEHTYDDDHITPTSAYLEEAEAVKQPSPNGYVDPLHHNNDNAIRPSLVIRNNTMMSEDEDVPLRVVDLIKRFSSKQR
jgi:hypothetical protein